MHTVKSISRIGCSVSIDESVYEDYSHAKVEYFYDENNDYSWDLTFGTDEGDGIWLVTSKNSHVHLSSDIDHLLGNYNHPHC